MQLQHLAASRVEVIRAETLLLQTSSVGQRCS